MDLFVLIRFEQRPCLFVALKNVSSLEVTDIKVELVKSSIGISFHHPLELERMAPGQEARCRTTLTLSEGAFQLIRCNWRGAGVGAGRKSPAVAPFS